jgi:hypothetical protein
MISFIQVLPADLWAIFPKTGGHSHFPARHARAHCICDDKRAKFIVSALPYLVVSL